MKGEAVEVGGRGRVKWDGRGEECEVKGRKGKGTFRWEERMDPFRTCSHGTV